MSLLARLPLLLLAVAAGCASRSVPDPSDWQQVQRARLDAQHRPRSPEQVLAEVLRNAPRPAAGSRPVLATGPAIPSDRRPTSTGPTSTGPTSTGPTEAPAPEPARPDPAPQEQHLDQRLPPPADDAARRFGHAFQPLVTTVDVGRGTAGFRVPHTGTDDSADASFARVRVDAGSGAALHGELWSSGDDLFAGRHISDGVDPAAADASLFGADLFPHVRFDQRLGSLRTPIRVGGFLDYTRLQHQEAHVEREWLSAGARVVLEPTLTLFGGDEDRVDLVGRIGGDIGPGWFREQFVNGQGSDSTLRFGGDLGASLRATLGGLQFEAGYRVHETAFGRIDSALYGNQSRTEFGRQQVFVGLGFTY